MKIKSEVIKTVVAISAMLVLFIAVVLVPYGYRDAGLTTRIGKAEQQLGIGSVDNEAMIRLHTEVKQLRKEMDGRGRYIPDEDQIHRVIKELSGLINEPGVSGQETVTDKAKYYADYNVLPVKIQFNAPFATAYDLVEKIEGLSSVVRVDHLRIEAESDYPHKPLTVYLQLSAFFANESKAGDS